MPKAPKLHQPPNSDHGVTIDTGHTRPQKYLRGLIRRKNPLMILAAGMVQTFHVLLRILTPSSAPSSAAAPQTTCASNVTFEHECDQEEGARGRRVRHGVGLSCEEYRSAGAR